MVSLGIIFTEILLFFILWIAVKIFIFKLAKIPFLFLTVKEGEAVAVMSGEKLDRIIMNMKGHYFDIYYNVHKTKEEADKEVAEIKRKKAEQDGKTAAIPEAEEKSIRGKIFGILKSLFSFSGIYWLGLPKVASVYEYSFTWTRMKFNPESKKKEKITTTEKIKWIYVKSYQYIIDLELSETFSMAPVSVPFFVRINIINPYVALFKNDSWLDVVSSAILDVARKFIATLDDPNEIMELEKGKKISAESGLIQKLPLDKKGDIITSFGGIILHFLKESGKYDYIEREVGAHISEIDVPSVDLGTWADLAIKGITAKKEGEAIIETAKAKSIALGLLTDAEAAGYRNVVEAIGPETYVALKNADNVAAAAKVGTNVVLDVGGIRGALAGIGGKIIADMSNGPKAAEDKEPVAEKKSKTWKKFEEIKEPVTEEKPKARKKFEEIK